MSSATASSAPAQQTGGSGSAPAAPATLVPSAQVLVSAAKVAIEQDKAIHLDYFTDTATNKAFLGEDPAAGQKMLVKSNEEYTSLVQKVYKVGEEYIILTENSLYIVSGKIQKRKIQVAALRGF